MANFILLFIFCLYICTYLFFMWGKGVHYNNEKIQQSLFQKYGKPWCMYKNILIWLYSTAKYITHHTIARILDIILCLYNCKCPKRIYNFFDLVRFCRIHNICKCLFLSLSMAARHGTARPSGIRINKQTLDIGGVLGFPQKKYHNKMHTRIMKIWLIS